MCRESRMKQNKKLRFERKKKTESYKFYAYFMCVYRVSNNFVLKYFTHFKMTLFFFFFHNFVVGAFAYCFVKTTQTEK